MDLVKIQFTVVTFGKEGHYDSHHREFMFKGTFEEAKTFLDQVMNQRIEVEKKAGNGKDIPF